MPSRCRGRHLPTSDIFRNDRLIGYTSSFYSSTKTPRERRTSRIYSQKPRRNRGFLWTLIAAVLLFLVFEAKLIVGSRKHIARTEVDLVSRFRLERLAKSSHVTYEGKTATFRKGTRVVKPLRRLRLWELLSTSTPRKESDISPLSVVVSLQPDNITQTYYLFTVQDAKKRMQLGVKIFRDRITVSFEGHRRTFSLTAEDAGRNTTTNTSSNPTSFAFLFEDGRITFYHNCGAKRETRDIPEFEMKSFINGSTDAKTKIILGRRRGENTAFVGRMCQFTLHRGAEAAQNFCNFLRRRCRRNNPRHGVPKTPTNTIYSGAATFSDQDSHFNPPNKDIGATPRDINEDVRWGSGDDPEPSQADPATLSRTVISNDSSIEFSSTSAYFNSYQSPDFSSRRFQTRIFHPILASPRSRRADATASAAATRGRTGVIRFPPGVETNKKSPKNKTAPAAGDRTSLSDSIKSPTSSAIFEDPLLFITDMHTVSPRGGKTLKENSRQSSIKTDSVGTIFPVATSKLTSAKESSQDQSTTTVYDPLSSIQSHEQTSTFSSEQNTDSFPSLVPNLLYDDVTVRDSVADDAPIGEPRQDETTDAASTNKDIDPLFIVPKLQTISPGDVIPRDSNQDDISNADAATTGDAPQDTGITTVANQPNAQGTHTSSKHIVTDPLFVLPKLQPLRPGGVTVWGTTATPIGEPRHDETTTPSASVEEDIQTDIPTTAATVEYLTTPETTETIPVDEEDLSVTETTTALPDDDQYRPEETITTSASNLTKTVEITIGQMTYNIPTWVSNYMFCKNETSGGKATLYLCGLVGPKGERGTRGPRGPPGRPGRRGREGMWGMYGPYGMPGLPGDPGPKGLKGHPGGFGLFGPKGHSGHKGDTGMIGQPGIVGKPGNDGDHGRSGRPGLLGPPGRPGEQGPPGLPGRQGQPGANGGRGVPGVEGDPGLDGLQGPRGLPGDYGEIGLEGPAGVKGMTGAEGDAGKTGMPGSDGQPGPPGIAGRTGLRGPTGIVGLRGPQGPPGPSDLKGFPGQQGPAGLKGDKGPKGPQGPTGGRGDKGEKGKVGLRGPPGRPGRGGLNGTIGDPGPMGPSGPTGEKGLPGHKGMGGPQGATGERGPQGQTGDHGQNGPRGETGDRGDDGMRGVTGPKGKKGRVGTSGKPGESGRKGYLGEAGRTGRMGTKGPPGVPGARGTPGFEGAVGERGEPGKQGTVGEKGPTGHPGMPGLPGPIGLPGPPGAPGITGPRGAPGEIGMVGSTGPPGQRGKDGEVGKKGFTGFPGAPGDRGEPGERGITGELGPKGYPGEIGEVGPEGNRGAIGYKGEIGLNGIQGDPGAPGETGLDGKEGKQGPTGKKGPRGDRGPEGPPGIVGREGIPGAPGLPGDPGERGLLGTKGVPGRPGIAGPLGNSGVIGDPGPDGPRGQQGYQGLTGLQGKVGLPGPQGAEGEKGEVGNPGLAGEPGVRLLAFGEKGVDGLKGIRGDRGPPGIDGEEGNQGPMGPKGFTGPPGVPGRVGFDGVIGLKGLAGEQGPKGKDGLKGNQGATGDPGVKGSDGDPGTQGERGGQGLRGEAGGIGENGHAGPRGKPGNVGERGPRGKDGKKGVQGTAGVPGSPGGVGPTGPKGEEGLPGRRGPDGPQGPTGIDGLPGPMGARGDTGPVGPPGKIGDRGPVGPPGERGQDGKPGPQGPRGVKGRMGPPGLMGAFGPEGFRGEKGKNGDPGISGKKGENGFPGPRGPQGRDGHRGDEGPIGIPGPRGEHGSAGTDGEPGPIGQAGPKGVTGPTGGRGSRGDGGIAGPQGKQGLAGRPGPPGPDVYVTTWTVTGARNVVKAETGSETVQVNDEPETVSRGDEYEEEPEHPDEHDTDDYGFDISEFGREIQYSMQGLYDAIRSHYHASGMSKYQPAATCHDVELSFTRLTPQERGNRRLRKGIFWVDPNEGCMSDAFQARCSFKLKIRTCLPSRAFAADEIIHSSSSVPNMDRYFQDIAEREDSFEFEINTGNSYMPTPHLTKSQMRFLHIRSTMAEQIILIKCRNFDIWTKDLEANSTSERYNLEDITFFSWSGKTLQAKPTSSNDALIRDKRIAVNLISDNCGVQDSSWQGAVIRVTSRNPAQLPVTRIVWPKNYDENSVYFEFGQVCFS